MEISAFRKIIGNSPVARVIEYLIECEGLDFSLSDIARGAKVGWVSLHRIWKDLEELGIVKFTRKVGNAKLYTLNSENRVAKVLIDLFKKAISLEKVSIKK